MLRVPTRGLLPATAPCWAQSGLCRMYPCFHGDVQPQHCAARLPEHMGMHATPACVRPCSPGSMCRHSRSCRTSCRATTRSWTRCARTWRRYLRSSTGTRGWSRCSARCAPSGGRRSLTPPRRCGGLRCSRQRCPKCSAGGPPPRSPPAPSPRQHACGRASETSVRCTRPIRTAPFPAANRLDLHHCCMVNHCSRRPQPRCAHSCQRTEAVQSCSCGCQLRRPPREEELCRPSRSLPVGGDVHVAVSCLAHSRCALVLRCTDTAPASSAG